MKAGQKNQKITKKYNFGGDCRNVSGALALLSSRMGTVAAKLI